MKKIFELDYPDGRMVIADILQKTLCRHWAMPVRVREIGQETGDIGVHLEKEELGILQLLADGAVLIHNVSQERYWTRYGPEMHELSHDCFHSWKHHGLLEPIKKGSYTISAKGRAMLAELDCLGDGETLREGYGDV